MSQIWTALLENIHIILIPIVMSLLAKLFPSTQKAENSEKSKVKIDTLFEQKNIQQIISYLCILQIL
jgi:hypothetical protein